MPPSFTRDGDPRGWKAMIFTSVQLVQHRNIKASYIGLFTDYDSSVLMPFVTYDFYIALFL